MELGLKDIEILHDENSAPYVNIFNENIKRLMELNKIREISLSISHDGEYSIAICNLKKSGLVNFEKINLPQIKEDSNKYDFGRVLIIGGSMGMTGSVLLASKAALRSGAGLVYILVPECIRNIIEIKTTEQIVYSLNDEGKEQFGKFNKKDLLNIIQNMSCIVIGPGMRQNQYTSEILKMVLESFEGPIVVDADAINMLNEHSELLNENIFITPHEMEFSRLSGYTLNEIAYDRESAVNNYLDRYDINILLKGKNSIVANRSGMYINDTGNNGLSTAGTGDVLAGIVSAFLCREKSLEMLKKACRLHGLCADYLALNQSKASIIASDIVEIIPVLIGD